MIWNIVVNKAHVTQKQPFNFSEYATHGNSVKQFRTNDLLFLSAGKIKFLAGFLCFKIISYF